jgi:hypothetical protein
VGTLKAKFDAIEGEQDEIIVRKEKIFLIWSSEGF